MSNVLDFPPQHLSDVSPLQEENIDAEVIGVLEQVGSFRIVYGDSSDGAVYVYKNDGDDPGLSSAVHQ
ncbi:hypothetical protein JHK85_010353 [Glycine max]|nr:hypothetical protein JHK85_010353 [Glycine max]